MWLLLVTADDFIYFFINWLYAGRVEECKECFRTFYSLMYRLNTYLKPHVSLLFILYTLHVYATYF